MKKFIVIIVAFFILILCGEKKSNVDYVYKEVEYTYVFLESSDNELIGVKVIKEADDLDEEIVEVFNYLTKRNNSLPIGYKNYMVLSTELLDYTYRDKTINLFLSDDFLRISNNYALKQLYYTYVLLGFENIFLYVNNEKLEMINDVSLEEGIPFFLANPVYDNFPKIINVYHVLDNEYIKPVSYFVPEDIEEIDAELICD